ncbi:DUF1398 domain-containing protein [Chitinophaga pinensis]|uniref:Phage envelope protein n=1 Tax=Chitinophaga pinensis (strain ATCC 43595 / DSM 2588 / LMG 13176 / NBRC 15968 / NCIMB 11800 / UQM 2034) TaxID=485918 RepID=A0A979GAR9_CHIPD|nr:DUF1398 domain-containing protein [Chitinophaga pinensis]ACU63760.1 putative phage envelope protein [Chitinophaga pinensis DSM 2588]
MFTLQQLKAAHAKVKTGADFPRYVQEIKGMGLRRYEYLVQDGTTVYYGDDNHQVESIPIYDPQEINSSSSAAALRHTIAIHQQGQTDFLTFCQQAANAGVEKWVIDTERMVCTYLDKNGAVLIEEPIPQGDYA